MNFISTITIITTIMRGSDAHGFLKSPRSRNYVANVEGVSTPQTPTDPAKEYEPQSLNLGGSLAACGMVGSRNYDNPPNSMGGTMPTNIQAVYGTGEIIDMDVVLTAHHKGHFNYYACAINEGDVPTDDCFKQNPLEFVEDPLYGAPKDPSFPYRAYIPPRNYEATLSSDGGQFYRHRMQLPPTMEGNIVLIQWHYLTGNSCKFDGYDTYAFPSDWPDLNYGNLPVCGPLPEDGRGTPEQFWNCAEITVLGSDAPPQPTTPAPVPAPSTGSPYSTYYPSKAPAGPPDNGEPLCGEGQVGNGVCPDSNLCCSTYGWCGSGVAYCGNPPPVVNPPPSPSPSTVAGQTPAPFEDPSELPVSRENRCGNSELDARGNCGTVCSGSNECASGEWCWGVHANYCGSQPRETCNDLTKATSKPRCGVDELHARELCGKSCSDDSSCVGDERCWGVHQNTCECIADHGRNLRSPAA